VMHIDSKIMEETLDKLLYLIKGEWNRWLMLLYLLQVRGQEWKLTYLNVLFLF
jgi:hypothetical protein